MSVDKPLEELRQLRWGVRRVAFRINPARILLLLLLLLLILVILFPTALAPYDPLAPSARDRLLSPSLAHPFGTDRIGRDILSRVVVGTRVSLLVSSGIVVFALSGGLLAGLLAGYYSRLDNLIMRIMDGFMAFPFILLAMAILAILGRTMLNLIIAVGIVYLPMIARIVRSVALTLRESDFVDAARAIGAPDRRIIIRHLLPNVIPILIVQATYFFARALLTEASLSFLGLGLPPDQPSWGVVLGEGRAYMRQAPWTTMFPGIAIAGTVLMLNVIGDSLRDRLDPRLRGTGSR